MTLPVLLVRLGTGTTDYTTSSYSADMLDTSSTY